MLYEEQKATRRRCIGDRARARRILELRNGGAEMVKSTELRISLIAILNTEVTFNLHRVIEFDKIYIVERRNKSRVVKGG